MKKRFVAFLLVLIMVLGMLPVSAMAAGSVVTARGSAENPIRIYENSGNQAETSYGSVQVPVGETVTDSGQLTFFNVQCDRRCSGKYWRLYLLQRYKFQRECRKSDRQLERRCADDQLSGRWEWYCEDYG